jgi:hypothetical protein
MEVAIKIHKIIAEWMGKGISGYISKFVGLEANLYTPPGTAITTKSNPLSAKRLRGKSLIEAPVCARAPKKVRLIIDSMPKIHKKT